VALTGFQTPASQYVRLGGDESGLLNGSGAGMSHHHLNDAMVHLVADRLNIVPKFGRRPRSTRMPV
jgi:hypothetical protein